MLEQPQKIKAVISNSFYQYLQTPITQRILPLIGITFYLTAIPYILQKNIPTADIFVQYVNIQTANLIIYISCLTLSNFITLIIYSTFMYFVYIKKIPFLQKYRISPNKPWPWQENYENWKTLFRKTIKTLLFNTIIVGVISLTIWSIFCERKVIMDANQIPCYSTIIWQFFVFLIVEDFTSTFTHSMLHQPSLYWIHKKHHQYTTSISISAEYAHPIEFIFSNSIPTIIGFKVLAYFYPVHLVSAMTWLIFRILLTSDLHSGYEFPWDFYKLIPLSAPASYHDFHHSHNVGNYASSFIFIEALFGTNKQYFKYKISKQVQKSKQFQQTKKNS